MPDVYRLDDTLPPEMARNSEKRLTGLNRFLEAKDREENREKYLKRPPLYKLGSADDVKRWIPSIKRDIEYLLQQISGVHASRNYQDQKIEEFKVRVDELKKEHQKFVAKVRALDPSYKDVTPWEPRSYSRKRPHEVQESRSSDSRVIKSQAKLDSNVRSYEDQRHQSRSCDNHMVKSHANPLKLDYSSSDTDSEKDESDVKRFKEERFAGHH